MNKPKESEYGEYSLTQILEYLSAIPDNSSIQSPGNLTKRLYEISYFDNFVEERERATAADLLEITKLELEKIFSENPEALESYQSANKFMEDRIPYLGIGSLAWMMNEYKIPDEDICDFIVKTENGHLLGKFLQVADLSGAKPAMLISLLATVKDISDDPILIIHQLILRSDPRIDAILSDDEKIIFKNAYSDRNAAENALKNIGIEG